MRLKKVASLVMTGFNLAQEDFTVPTSYHQNFNYTINIHIYLFKNHRHVV